MAPISIEKINTPRRTSARNNTVCHAFATFSASSVLPITVTKAAQSKVFCVHPFRVIASLPSIPVFRVS
ncbi:hypothetical protein KCP70_03365 [Salmonella enterica subsp. enterica]|nr:hypothetical protein KCP70_03365 [Salmonella enterica subsp. enterica]